MLPEPSEFDLSLRHLVLRENPSIGDQLRTTCPACSHSRKSINQRERCLSVQVEAEPYRVVYNCWHCFINGVSPMETGGPVPQQRPRTKPKPAPVPISQTTGGLSPLARQYLTERGVLKAAEACGVFSAVRWFRKANAEIEGLAFPYFDAGQPIGVKYRCITQKDFSWEGNSSVLWMADKVEGDDGDLTIVICEGEMDALSLVEAGVENVLSIPNGAIPVPKDGQSVPNNDKRLAYLGNNEDLLTRATKVVLALDEDEPGEVTGEELARRIGKVKCWRTRWPDGCNDANDTLLAHGVDEVFRLIEDAKPWPVAGLYDADHYTKKIETLYLKGNPKGVSTGFDAVDKLMTIVPGQVTIATGIPSSGKSEFIDAMMVNIAEAIDWKFAICSFENPPEFHIVKLMEKRGQLPFHNGPNARMSPPEMKQAQSWVNDHFSFIDQSDGEPSTIESILDRASAAVLRFGVRGVVIDPYNYIEPATGKDESETKTIDGLLSKIRRFAVSHDVHVWFVAHPTKMRRNDDGTQQVPGGYDISGSAAWFNKADIGLTIHRTDDDQTEVHLWKVRFKWIGEKGKTTLSYDKLTGRYHDAYDWDAAGSSISGGFPTKTAVDENGRTVHYSAQKVPH